MAAMVTRGAATRDDGSPVCIGVLAPLTRPGWTAAGRHLVAGCEVAATEINRTDGVAGRPLELLVRDTAADPDVAVRAAETLVDEGVVALAGEYHSVVARAVASWAVQRQVPFACSSAVLDALTDEPSPWVARIAPAQSYGWRIYADHLLDQRHERIAVATQPSVYWAAGTRVLRQCFADRGGEVVELDAGLGPQGVCDAVADAGVSALLLLVGHPAPIVDVVRAVRADRRLSDVLLGAPAGQPEFADWLEALGHDGAGVPFLRYLPGALGATGHRVVDGVHTRLGEPASFVAFEGYDTIRVLAEVLRTYGTSPAATAPRAEFMSQSL